MSDTTLTILINALRETAHPLTGATTDYDPLMKLIGDARFVLLGEATHGTHEFYRARAEITKRLITEKGFVAVAVEADWPDAYRVNRYVRGINDDATARDALAGFKRFPLWMWRNKDVLDFIEWLRTHNTGLPPDARKTGFYGLDLYSLHASIEAVVSYLEMARTLEALVTHLDREGGATKVVVWAHNSHVGDARATSMGSEGELNVGQLVRERYGREAVLVGFSTYTGTVTAASDWGAPLERKRVRPALPGSYEALFHQAGLSNFLFPLRNDSKAANALRGPRPERAIGVIYLPQTERISHYFHARLPEQFDAVLHFDETQAVEPLDRTTQWEVGETEIPETYPSAL